MRKVNGYPGGVRKLSGSAASFIAALFLMSGVVTSASAADDTKVAAQDQEKTRVGTCEDARAQTKYWCEEREQVTVVSFGLECENAKKNAEEACEGITSSTALKRKRTTK